MAYRYGDLDPDEWIEEEMKDDDGEGIDVPTTDQHRAPLSLGPDTFQSSQPVQSYPIPLTSTSMPTPPPEKKDAPQLPSRNQNGTEKYLVSF